MAPLPPDTGKGSLATRAIHGDHEFIFGKEVAPNISVSTTFRHLSPDELTAQGGHIEWNASNPDHDIYSRYTQPTLTRAEKALSSVIGAPTLLYPSGISATLAVLLHVLPDTIAITEGYHGCHGCIEIYQKTRGIDKVRVIKLEDDYPEQGKLLCWVETPLNPTGECRSIEFYARKAHKVGGILAVDSTFAPPPLQDPFHWGADIVMHSGTKYFGGHSDSLTGTVSVKSEVEWQNLWHNRTYTGSNAGSLEAWLVLRSLRTLPIRIAQQSKTATALAQWLWSLTRATPGTDLDGPSGVIAEVWHATLQDGGGGKWVGSGKQMTGGPACFGIRTTKAFYAEQLPHALNFFTPATSLGGVESLIEQRVISAPDTDPCVIRLSIGLEDFQDLKADLIRGMKHVVQIEKSQKAKL